MSRFLALLAVSAVVACSGNQTAPAVVPAGRGQPAPAPAAPSAAPAPAVATAERLLVRTGAQTVVVDSPAAVGRRVERLMLATGGYLERANARSGDDVEVVGRVPAHELAPLMDSVARLGFERRRHITGSDVTDAHADLEARLRSTIALRDRVQLLLARATTLEEILTLERQIARLQAEIDAQQARLDQLRSNAAFAALAVTLERRPAPPGPLTVAGRGIVRFVGKLF